MQRLRKVPEILLLTGCITPRANDSLNGITVDCGITVVSDIIGLKFWDPFDWREDGFMASTMEAMDDVIKIVFFGSKFVGNVWLLGSKKGGVTVGNADMWDGFEE